jgi:hypothetical protein
MQRTLLNIPDWLTQIPRRVHRRNWAAISLLRLSLLPFILLGIGAILAMLGIAAWLEMGTDRPVIVENIRVTHSGKSPFYHVSYRYQIAHRTMHGQTMLNEDEFDQLTQTTTGSPSSTLHARTLGAPPLMYEHALESGDNGWMLATEVWAWSAVLIGMGRAAYFFAFQLPRRQENLYRLGEIAPGEIVQKYVATQGKLLSLSLRYKFTPPDGQTRVGNLHVNRRRWDQADQGQTIHVLYDADDPAISTIYEFGDFVAKKTGE